jgi:hypothetical protein
VRLRARTSGLSVQVAALQATGFLSSVRAFTADLFSVAMHLKLHLQFPLVRAVDTGRSTFRATGAWPRECCNVHTSTDCVCRHYHFCDHILIVKVGRASVKVTARCDSIRVTVMNGATIMCNTNEKGSRLNCLLWSTRSGSTPRIITETSLSVDEPTRLDG